ncbi:hypothetical protein [Streptomyces sp. Ru62]|nr:hypothetical protein [Streptomyces sp. Ru62]
MPDDTAALTSARLVPVRLSFAVFPASDCPTVAPGRAPPARPGAGWEA